MANETEVNVVRLKFYDTIKHFPPVLNGRINIVEYLEAAQDLVRVVDRMGKVLAPVKYDMQGNIDKIKKLYYYDENSCLLELMINEKSAPNPQGIESVVWLNRAILFFELVFQELIVLLQTNQWNVSAKKIFTMAYEGSVKKYHNWVTQQIFAFICKMGPSIPQILQSIEADSDTDAFKTSLTNSNIKLHIIRSKIDDFVRENDLFDKNS